MFLEILTLAMGVPTGFLMAYWANDELVAGRKWFVLIMGAALVCGIATLSRWTEISLTCAFIFIVAMISYWKSFDKNWIRRRI